MLKLSEVKIPVGSETTHLEAIAGRLCIKPAEVLEYRVLKKSLDARRRDCICYVYSFAVHTSQDGKILKKKIKNVSAFSDEPYGFKYKNLVSDVRPLIVGTGPAGLFCALMLARAGLEPVVVERGEPVEERERTVECFRSGGALCENSNVQFGEGGAGTFSDGKLTCGVNDRRIAFVLGEFVRHGAPEETEYLAKPHIGTDYLKHVVREIRREIISLGGEVRFNTLFTGFETDGERIKSAVLKSLKDGSESRERCEILVLATGNSSRDTYQMLSEKGVKMVKKPFSVGVRIEHRRDYINALQYGDAHLADSLPAADYKLSCHPGGRGVYTFCMCPGGAVIAGASERGGVVTNGMSCFARDMENSNSALLVSVLPEDIPGSSPLGGVEFQRSIEQKAYMAGGGDYFAPCQKAGDFLKGTSSHSFGSVKPSYRPGVRFARLDSCLPDFVCSSLRAALAEMDRKMPGFCLDDAVLTGVETRSSAPLRILRGEDMSSEISGLYPIGEGAGYAGGIMSSAADGIKCAEKIAELIKKGNV